MAVVAAFTVPAETFPLGVVFESFENVTVELERVVPLAEGVMPYLWVHGADREAVEAAFATELPEQELEVLDSDGTDHLVRVRWSPETDGFLQTLLDSELSLLSAEVTTTEWTFEVRAPSRDDLSAFQARCRESGVSLRLKSLHGAVPIEPPQRAGLTEKQHEAVLLAYRMGYFDSPRQAGLAEIAAELDISRQALASRLRRGLRHIVGNALQG
jgi:predicted DNA binding protein